MTISNRFTIQQATQAWKNDTMILGDFRSIYSGAYQLLSGRPESYSQEDLHGYFEHTSIEIETAISSSINVPVDNDYLELSIREIGSHALSALMLRQTMPNVPMNQLPDNRDFLKVFQSWNIVRNIYTRGDRRPNNDESNDLYSILSD
jgi:hypothetical protein